MQMQEHYRGKSCVVTGAASGIGFALSEAMLKAGAVVFMADRDTGTLDVVTKQLAEHGDRVHAVTVDVTKQEQVKRLIEDAALCHGRLDFLFNNAGIGGTIPFEMVTLEHWRRLIDINLWGVIYGIDAAVPIMRRQGGGTIVNTSSIAGIIPAPFQALYCTTKFAVLGLSESLRFELADEGIHVSVVCPGNVATRIFGTPIIGDRVEVKPPDDAVSAEDAAQTILTGVAEKQGIIALPEKFREQWRWYWSNPEAADAELRKLARERREAIKSKGSYY